MPNPDDAPLSEVQRTMLDLALSCDLKVSPHEMHAAIRARHQTIVRSKDAADYIREVETKIHARRKFLPK
jgi:hypothetical protein